MMYKLKGIRLLLLDDDPDDRMLILRALRKEFRDLVANEITDEVSFNIALEEGNFDVVVTDYNLRWSNGIEVLKKVKMSYPNCPVIMFTGTGSEEIAVEAMKMGLDDYVLKSPKHFIKLPVTIKSAIEKSMAKIEQEKIQKELKESEERYRMLFETSPEAILVIGTDGTIIDCNSATVEIWDLKSKEELVGKKIIEIEFLEKESLTRLNELFSKFLKGEVSGILETEIEFKNRIIWIEIYPSFLKRNGEVYAIQAVIRDITERKLIEKALRKREEEYRTLVENANEAIIVIQDGKIRFANPKTYEAGGYSEHDLISKYFLDFVHPEDRDMVLRNYKKRLSGEEISDVYSFRVFDKNGKIRWVEANAVLIEWEGRQATLNFLTDITTRKESEEELKKSEFEKSLILNSTSEHIVYQDPNHTILWANKAAADSVNEEVGNLSGRKCYEIWHHRHEPCENCPVSEAINTGRFQEGEVQTPDGRWWYIRANPVKDLNGNLIGIVEVTADITARKKTEGELKKSEEKYRTLVELMNEGLGVLDENGTFTYVNKRFCEIIGYSMDEIIGKPVIKFLDKDNRRILEEQIKKREKRIKEYYELSWTHKLGIKIPTIISPQPIFDSEGNYKGCFAVITDISKIKLVEKALKESEARLKSIFKAAPIGLGIIVDHVFESVNDKFCEMTGYSREELIGYDARMVYLDEEEYERVSVEKYAQIRKYGIGSVETKFRRKDGKIIDVLLSTSPIEPSDLSKGMIFTAMDITGRNKAMKKLEESEKRYRTTFEHTGTAMVIIEEDTTLSLVNSEFEKLSGYKREEIEGKMSWTQFVHPDDLERMKKYHYARRRGEEVPKRYEFRFIDKEGNVKNIFLAIDLIPGTKKTVGSLMDITQMKRVNNLLKSISEINELVAREKNPKIVLKTVCDKLTMVYDAVFTSLRINEDLIPVESKGISLKSIKNALKRCPSIMNALNGITGKMRMDDETCRHCTRTPHRFVLSIPLIYNGTKGVITIHSSNDFNKDEITLLEKLSRNIAFAISVYKVEEEKKKAFEQLAANLMQFEYSADRLRNPLAAIMASLELRNEIDHEKLIKIIDESAKRIKKELDELRKEEIKTFKLMEDMK